MRQGIALVGCAIVACLSLVALAEPTEATLSIPAGVRTTGALPIPMTLVHRAEPYTKFRPSTLLDWHPFNSTALILRPDLASGREHLHLVDGPATTPALLDTQPDVVMEASFQPKDGNHVLVRTRAADGATMVSIMALSNRRVSRISPPGESAGQASWNSAGDRVVFATFGRQSKLYIGDPRLAGGVKLLATAEAGRWREPRFSADGNAVVYVQEDVDSDSLWMIDPATAVRRRIVQGAANTRYNAPQIAADGLGLWATVKVGGNTRRLSHLSLEGAETVVTTNPNSDVVEFAISQSAARIAVNTTENGSSVLRFFDLLSRKELLRPALLPGEITGIRWIPSANKDPRAAPAVGAAQAIAGGHQIGFSLASTRAPRDLFVYDVDTTKLVRWTNGAAPGLNAFQFIEPSTLSGKIDENRNAKADLYLPDPARFPGRRPVLVVLPATNAMASPHGFIGKYQFLLNELGIAVCYPSVGGGTHLNMATLIDRIGQQSTLDADRVILQSSPSDGLQTFVSLLQRLPRIAGGIFIGDNPSTPTLGRAPMPLFVVQETNGRLTPDSTWQISIASDGAAGAVLVRNFVFYAQLRFLQLIAGQSELLPQDETPPNKQPL